jgi:hypothetical protein
MTDAETRTRSPEPSGIPSAAIGEVTLTLSDIEAGLSVLPRAKVARTIAWGGALAVVGLIGYRWMEGRDRTSLIIIAVILLGLLSINRNPANRIAKKVYASLPEDSKTLRVSVDEAGFRVNSSGNESLLPWTDVQRCVETRNVLVVFVSQHDAQIIPKRAFSPAELQAIRKWSQTKIVKHQMPSESWFTPQLRTRMMIWLAVFAVVWAAFMTFGNR